MFFVIFNILFELISILDPNIQETGEQEFKSNYGPKDCCYSYCGYPSEGLCSNTCDFIFNGNASDKIKNAIAPLSSNNYVKIGNNEYIINDNTELPYPHLSCPAMPNATLQPTQCILSQAISKSSSSTLSPFSSSLLIKTADYYLNNNKYNNINIYTKNLSNNYWTILIYNLLKFSAITKILLQLARL